MKKLIFTLCLALSCLSLSHAQIPGGGIISEGESGGGGGGGAATDITADSTTITGGTNGNSVWRKAGKFSLNNNFTFTEDSSATNGVNFNAAHGAGDDSEFPVDYPLTPHPAWPKFTLLARSSNGLGTGDESGLAIDLENDPDDFNYFWLHAGEVDLVTSNVDIIGQPGQGASLNLYGDAQSSFLQQIGCNGTFSCAGSYAGWDMGTGFSRAGLVARGNTSGRTFAEWQFDTLDNGVATDQKWSIGLSTSLGTGFHFYTGGEFTHEDGADVLLLLPASINAYQPFEIKEVSAPGGVAGYSLLWSDSTAHRLQVKDNNGSAKSLAYTSEITDAGLATTDVTTNDVSTSKHGFAPKLDNNSAHFLDGTGAWTTPPDLNTHRQILMSQTSANVSNSAVNYFPISGNATPNASAIFYNFLPAGTLKNLVCGLSGGFNALTGSQTYKVEIGTISGLTALTCTIAVGSTCQNLANNYFGTAVCCEDTTHTVTIPAPASNSTAYYIKGTPTNTPTANPMVCSMELNPS